MIDTIQVEPKFLQAWWPFVKRGLKAIIKKSQPDWIPEDVYSALRSDNALLHVSRVGGHPIGFTISYFAWRAFNNAKELFVWQAYTLPLAERPTGMAVQAAVEHTWNQLLQIAKAAQCERIVCISTRKGFEKWAKQWNMVKVHSTYARLI